MARDVEFNVTASDKAGNALSSAARKVEQTQRKMAQDAEKAFGGLGRSLIATANLAGPKIGQAVTRGIAQAAQLAGPLLASAAAYAAPLIAGTLSAAVVGGAGIGGVVGGIALAARDPRVKSAGAQLGDSLLGSLTDAARPFVDVTLQGIDRIRAGYQQVEGNIKRIFANSARFVGPLTEGAVAFAQSLIRGFDTLVAKAAPVIAAIRSGLQQAGSDLEDFFATIAGDGQAAATTVKQLFDLFSGALAVLGPMIRALTEINGLLDRFGIQPGILQFIGAVSKANEETGTFARHVAAGADGFVHVNENAANYADTLEALAETQRRIIGETNSLYGAQTNAAKAFRDAKKAIEENGAGLALNTARGIENRQTLANLAQGLNAEYDAFVKVNGAGEAANEVLRRNRANFIEVATKASGSAAAARKLADDLIGIPDRKPVVELLDKASGKINNVINRLSAVKSKTVTINVAVKQSGDAAALRKQNQTSVNAASSYFAAAAGGGQYRTGGPAPVQVANTVTVLLDGRPFRQATSRVVENSQQREAWRNRVGAK